LGETGKFSGRLTLGQGGHSHNARSGMAGRVSDADLPLPHPESVRDLLGITAAGGQDHLKGKIFRIAHLGYADTFDVIIAASAVEMVLKGMGYPVKLGSGVGMAQEILMKS